jgi:hypothetical protein
MRAWFDRRGRAPIRDYRSGAGAATHPQGWAQALDLIVFFGFAHDVGDAGA